MSADRRIGSQAPLWRMGSPVLVLRVGWPVLVVFVALVLLVVFGPADRGSGYVIGAWVLGVVVALLLIAVAVGFAVLRRMSANVRRYAAAAGFAFAVRNRDRTDNWRIAPNCDGRLSRDVVTGTLYGGRLVSFLHQSFVHVGRSRATPGGLAGRHILGVRVTVVDVGRQLPSVELTPRRLPGVESRTLPTGAPVPTGVAEIDTDYHVATDNPEFAAELFAPEVVAVLRQAPRLAVRTNGTRVIVLAPPLRTTADDVADSVRLLRVLCARLAELELVLARRVSAADAPPPDRPGYVAPSVGRWRLAPFGTPLAEAGMTEVRRGVLGSRPYLAFVHERVVDTGTQRRVREQVVAVALPARLPHLEVWPDSTLRAIAPGMAVREDVDIESDEFNRRYQVAAADRRYAVDVLNPRAVEALLAVPDFEWRIDGSDLVGLWNADTAPDAVPARLAVLNTIAKHIPAHVVADHGWAAEPADVDSTIADVDTALGPARAVHIVLAAAAGLVVLAAGVPIARAVTDGEPGAWIGGAVVVGVIAFVVVTLVIVFGRVIDGVRRMNGAKESTRDPVSRRTPPDRTTPGSGGPAGPR